MDLFACIMADKIGNYSIRDFSFLECDFIEGTKRSRFRRTSARSNYKLISLRCMTCGIEFNTNDYKVESFSHYTCPECGSHDLEMV